MNYRFAFNRNVLKYLAAFAMLVDHIGVLCLPEGSTVWVLCRIPGRVTAPVMCWFLAEGFCHTSSKKRYAARLLLFAVLSQPAYDLAHGQTVAVLNLNVLFCLFLSFCVLWVYTEVNNRLLCFVGIALLLVCSSRCDWGVFAPLWVLLFYVYRENRGHQAIAFSVISCGAVAFALFDRWANGLPWYGAWWQAGLFLFLPLLFCYNRERGSGHAFHKWFFYAFYPAHLLLLGLINEML